MKYNYNYGFLQQWLDANKHIPRGVINEAFATSSNNRIKAGGAAEDILGDAHRHAAGVRNNQIPQQAA